MTWAQKVHCNLCNKCYTLGMPGPRPDIRCVQYLPKVHPKVPIKFSVPSGTSEVIDWHQRSKTLLNVETEIHHIMGWIHHIIWCWREIFKISYRCTYSWRNIKDTSWGCTSTCRILQDTSHPSALVRVIHFILDLKTKLIIFFSWPELPVTHFHSFFSLQEKSYLPAKVIVFYFNWVRW